MESKPTSFRDRLRAGRRYRDTHKALVDATRHLMQHSGSFDDELKACFDPGFKPSKERQDATERYGRAMADFIAASREWRRVRRQ